MRARFAILLCVAGCDDDAVLAADGDAATAAADGPTGDLGADAHAGDCPPPSLRPTARSEHAGALDVAGEQLLVFGGTTAVPEMCGFPDPDFTDELWALDERCAAWREIEAKGPSARGRHMTAWDAQARRMFVFGGRFRAGGTTYTLHDDLWAFDAAGEEWTLIDDGGGAGPRARVSGALGYDAEGDALWLFGGDTSQSGAAYDPQDDTWRFELAKGAWEEIDAGEAEGQPAPRLLVAYAFDAARRRLLVFGGADERAFSFDAEYFGDLWALDAASPAWVRLAGGADPGGPDGRFFPGLVVDDASGRIVIFSGHDAGALGNRNDLWTFDDEGGWDELREGDQPNEGSLAFCEFPANFVAFDLASPERRSAPVFAAGGGRAWVFGGKTDCGAIDDAWKLSFASLAWEEAAPATVGEACVRAEDGDDS
ncbi:MAG: kelch repeat-containing protein, partial [Myxococcota bacterium]